VVLTAGQVDDLVRDAERGARICALMAQTSSVVTTKTCRIGRDVLRDAWRMPRSTRRIRALRRFYGNEGISELYHGADKLFTARR